jgi:hypothetical protein
VAVHENTNELFVFGKTNLQTFAPDPQSTWSPVVTREFGCIAPYSIVKDDQSFAWLDDKRRIVHSDGRSFKVISGPIQRELDDLDSPEDCYGYRVRHGVTDVLVFAFGQDGRSYVVTRDGSWSQWSGWNGNWMRMPVLSASQGEVPNLVGLRDGRVGKYTSAATTDLGDPIQAQATTAFIDHGTQQRKTCKEVAIRIRRPLGTGPVGFLSWRDDLGPWKPPLTIDLGVSQVGEIVVRKHSLGVYRQRQWRFQFGGDGEVVVGSVTESFEVNP